MKKLMITQLIAVIIANIAFLIAFPYINFFDVLDLLNISVSKGFSILAVVCVIVIFSAVIIWVFTRIRIVVALFVAWIALSAVFIALETYLFFIPIPDALLVLSASCAFVTIVLTVIVIALAPTVVTPEEKPNVMVFPVEKTDKRGVILLFSAEFVISGIIAGLIIFFHR